MSPFYTTHSKRRRAIKIILKRKASFFKDATFYTGMTLVAQILAFVGGTVSTRLLGPINSGIWNSLLIAFTYGGYLDFGIRTGIGRELPIKLGTKNSQEEEKLREVGFFATLVSAICTMVILLTWAQIFSQNADPLFVHGLRLIAITAFFFHFCSFYQTLCRSYGQFKLLGILQVFFSGMGLAIGVPMIAVFALPGRMWAFLVTYMVYLILIAWRSGIVPRLRIDIARSISIAQVGLPIFAAVVLYGFLLTVDRLFIGSMLGMRELGFFSLGSMTAQYLLIIPNSVGEVLYPTMAKEYGRSNENAQSLTRLFFVPLFAVASLMSAAILVISLLIPAFIFLILPDFYPSISVVQISIFGTYFIGLCGPAGSVLIIINKRYQYLKLLSAAVVLNAVLDFVVLKLGGGMEAVAIMGPIISWGCYSIAIISLSAGFIGMSWTKTLLLLIKTYSPIIYAALILFIVNHLIPFSEYSIRHLIRTSSLRLLYFALVSLPLAWWSNRELGWVRIVKARIHKY